MISRYFRTASEDTRKKEAVDSTDGCKKHGSRAGAEYFLDVELLAAVDQLSKISIRIPREWAVIQKRGTA